MNQSASKSTIFLVVFAIVAVVGLLLYFFVFDSSARYKKVIKNADEKFEMQQLAEARLLYEEALGLSQEETYPVKRIYTIDSLLDVAEMTRLYDEKLNMADKLFSQEKYEEARDYYFEALNINSDDVYPVNQIRKIEELLNTGEAQQESGEVGTAGGNFHVIVGVFEREKNVMALRKKLAGQGLSPQVFNRPDEGMKAVSWGSYPDIHSAYSILRQVQKEFCDDAWVLYEKRK